MPQRGERKVFRVAENNQRHWSHCRPKGKKIKERNMQEKFAEDYFHPLSSLVDSQSLF
jgi:hypothetical protein